MQSHARPRKFRNRPPRAYDLEGFPPEAVAEAEAIQAEMDIIHPGWRDYAPYMYPFERRARVTWCLYRLEKQVVRWEAPEQQQGTPRLPPVPSPRLDWRVRIVRAGPRDPDQDRAFPHPVSPSEDWHPSWYEPPPLEMTAAPVGPSASELAFEIDMPLERVERLLPSCPVDTNPAEWLADIKRRTGGAR